MATQDQLAGLKAQTRSLKIWCRAARDDLTDLAKSLRNDLGNDLSARRLEKRFQVWMDKSDQLVDLYSDFINYDISMQEDIEKRIGEQVGEASNLRREVSGALKAFADQRGVDTISEAAGPNLQVHELRTKVNSALKPEKLTATMSPAEMERWIMDFETYYSASNMELSTLQQQQAYMFRLMSHDMQVRIRSQITDRTGIFNVGGMADTLRAEFKRIYPVSTRRYRLFTMTQAPDQSARDYYLAIRDAAEQADAGRLRPDDIIAMLLLSTTTNNELRDDMMKSEADDLQGLLRLIDKFDRARQGRLMVGDAQQEASSYRSAQQGQSHRGRPQGRGGYRSSQGRDQPSQGCHCCGHRSHTKPQCHFLNMTCHTCKKKGHLPHMCKSSRTKDSPQVRQAGEDADDDEDEDESIYDTANEDGTDDGEFVDSSALMASACSTEKLVFKTPSLTFHCSSKDGSVHFLQAAILDTGATESLISENVLDKHRVPFEKIRGIRIKSASDMLLCCPGRVSLRLRNRARDIATVVRATVIRDTNNMLLIGFPDLVRTALIPLSFPGAKLLKLNKAFLSKAADNRPKPSSAQEFRERLLKDFCDVMSDALPSKPMAGPPVKIHLRTDMEVVTTRAYTARQIPIHQVKEANSIIAELLDKNVISQQSAYTEWCSPAFFVPKHNGKLRLVCDWRGLNKYLKRAPHPFSSARDIVNAVLPESKVFCTFDCVQGYHQLKLDDSSADLTTFILPSGRYRMERLGMGLVPSMDEFCKRSDEATAQPYKSQKPRFVRLKIKCIPSMHQNDPSNLAHTMVKFLSDSDRPLQFYLGFGAISALNFST